MGKNGKHITSNGSQPPKGRSHLVHLNYFWQERAGVCGPRIHSLSCFPHIPNCKHGILSHLLLDSTHSFSNLYQVRKEARGAILLAMIISDVDGSLAAVSLKRDEIGKGWNPFLALLTKCVHLIQQKRRYLLCKEQLWHRSQLYKAELLKNKLNAMKCPLVLVQTGWDVCLIQVCPEGVRAVHCSLFSSHLPRVRKKGDAFTLAPELSNYPQNEKYNRVVPTSPYFLCVPFMLYTYASVTCWYLIVASMSFIFFPLSELLCCNPINMKYNIKH